MAANRGNMPKHNQTSGRTLSGFQRWWDIITTHPHERPLWVLVQKCLFSLSARHEGSLGARNRDSPMISSGEENPSSFPLVVGAERAREEGRGALLVHHALAFSNNSIPRMFQAQRSSDNTRRSSGAISFLHQWAKVGPKKKKKYTCF